MRLERISVIPKLPKKLQWLQDLSQNLWWSWNPKANQLFESMDPALWKETHHNPTKLLQQISQAKLEALATDNSFLGLSKLVQEEFANYLKNGCPHPELDMALTGKIAYFSAEFGLHESLPVYSGGLGILAGDHCKTASDLGIPLVGIGLMYKSGYFKQALTAEGHQLASYPEHNFDELPIRSAKSPEGEDIHISLHIKGREVKAKVWHVDVGRVPLYLLDTDVEGNDKEAQQITSKLYGGGVETRIAQEMLLGIGGIRALQALQIDPSVYHINEGHAAFLSLERLKGFLNDGLEFKEALHTLSASQVFTTHTPVPAGHDRFGHDMLSDYLGAYLERAGLSYEKIRPLGIESRITPNYKENQDHGDAPFCMTALALRTSRLCNGVSQLHGEVSRKMWQEMWPDVPESEVPIGHVTNGVHVATWINSEICDLYTKYVGDDWQAKLSDEAYWDKVKDIPDAELWKVHLELKQRLVSFVRERTLQQRQRLNESFASQEAAKKIMDPNALTIGFARRFAPYKRATLVFRDAERLKRILNQPGRPVQLVFAGKSHPHNQEGKDLIRDVYYYSRQPGFEGKIIFLEDYDTEVSRHMVQGVDVWLNNPRRPQEASGTSGQKVPINGGINFSVLDGWWVEGYKGNNGWPIGLNEEVGSKEHQDSVDASTLYDTLEQQIVPMYYGGGEGNELPKEWIQTMKASIKTVIPHFNTERMLVDYLRDFYEPADKMGKQLEKDGCSAGKALTSWKAKLERSWSQVQIQEFTRLPSDPLTVHENYTVSATVQLGELNPEEVTVECFLARFDKRGEAHPTQVIQMNSIESSAHGAHRYHAKVQLQESGEYGYNIRVRPQHTDITHIHETGLLCWG